MPADVLVERGVAVPMRDGARLVTDVYRPAADDRCPVLVLRSPYGRSNAWNVGSVIFNPLDAVERGYVVLVQDVRGRFASEGTWRPFACEAADGYDTVEWAATQSWSDASIGVYGSSYDGVACLQAAKAAPPHLKAALAYVTGGNYHNGWAYSGGAFELGFNLRWSTSLAWDALARVYKDEERDRLGDELALAATDPAAATHHLPLRDVRPFADLVGLWTEWLQHPAYDDFWRDVDVVAHANDIAVPLLHIGGWYDNFLRGHLDLNEALKSHPDERVRGSHRLILGPWDHEAYLSIRPASAGEREFGPAATGGAASMSDVAFQWFDHWLRGRRTPLLGEPRVRYFEMGSLIWRTCDEWPPPHRPIAVYLHSGGHANSRFGDGHLSNRPPGFEPPDSYIYDPADPVPTVGGRTLSPALGPGGVQDQAKVEERHDVLVYTSANLTTPVAIAGPVSVRLTAATSARDTDFTAKLVDVEPDGYCANLAEGIIRCRYRNHMAKAEFLDPGEVVELFIDLWDVAHVFRAGHRIRLEISSSNFPRFDRNLNSEVVPADGLATDLHQATQQVFHDAGRASRLILPVVEGTLP